MPSSTPTPASNPGEEPLPSRNISYLSPPAEVSMTDGYFELASLDHFWVRRRFEVFRQLADPWIRQAREIADIGCGHGLLQRQIEIAYGRPVTGFDLNEFGLKRNVSQISRVCCYDIYQRNAEFAGKFALILLFDVLEHIAEEDAFLRAVLFHLAPGGNLVVSVPAGPWAYSGYDRAAGHVRRYSIDTLRQATERNGLTTERWSYWGFPLLPTLLFRKLWLAGKQDLGKVYSAGFHPGSKGINKLLARVSELEVIPQKLAGTSVMAVLRWKVS